MLIRLLIVIVLTFTTVIVKSQTTPPSKTRSNSDFTQVDEYLSVTSRLGIPTTSGDNLIGDRSPQQTVKLVYNTTLRSLRIYDPVSGNWYSPTEDLSSLYYNKGQVDSLLLLKQNSLTSGVNIKTINGQSILGSGNITIEGSGGGGVGTLQQVTTLGSTTDTDLEITDFNKGVIIRSPNNSRWRVQITNDGQLSVTKL